LWIGVILFLGSGAGAMPETSRFIGPLLRYLFPEASAELLVLYHGFIRKLAHFVEYSVLGFLAVRVFRGSTTRLVARHWPAASLLLVIATAAIDELLQSFNPARTGSPWDVVLDFVGGITGVMVFWALCRRNAVRSPGTATPGTN
jgi:VanZ family protein